MIRNKFSYRSLLTGLGLLGLLALMVSWFILTPPLTGATGPEDDTDVATVEPPADVHLADRKFFTHNYATAGPTTANTHLLAGVHPADRKFFIHAYGTETIGAAGGSSQSLSEPADRRRQELECLQVLFGQVLTARTTDVELADRKFFAEGYIWSARARETAVDGD